MTNDPLKRYTAIIMVELSAECKADAVELLEATVRESQETDMELKEIVGVFNNSGHTSIVYKDGV